MIRRPNGQHELARHGELVDPRFGRRDQRRRDECQRGERSDAGRRRGARLTRWALAAGALTLPWAALPATGQEPSGAALVAPQQVFDVDGRRIERWDMGSLVGAPEPDPALTYLFRPTPFVPRPGNAAIGYLEAIREAERARRGLEGDAQQWDSVWLDLPIESLPLDEVGALLDGHRRAFEAIDRATESAYCDWQIESYGTRSVADLLAIDLESQQQMRQLARLVSLDTRYAIATRDWRRAEKDIRRMAAMARDVSKPSLLITSLIGIAIQNISYGDVRSWIAAEGSPNLYWALSSLPEGPSDMREALFGEMRLLRFGFEAFDRPEEKDWSAEQWRSVVRRDFGRIMPSVSSGALDETALDGFLSGLAIRGYPIAKERLIAEGFDPARLEAMPVLQVVCIYEGRAIKRIADDFFKWTLVDGADRSIGLADAEQAFARTSSGFADFDRGTLTPLVGLLMPALSAAARAEVRTRQSRELLRTIEALRLHVAATNSIPSSLDEIEVVPVPNDPATGAPFDYRVYDDRVEIRVDAIPGVRSVYVWKRPSSDGRR